MAQPLPKAKELRGLSPPERQAQLDKLRQELWQARQKVKEGSLQQMHLLPALRRQIARLLTVMNEHRGSTS
jgi:ribosomal protein L29